MARSPRRDDEDALDPVEEADEPVDGEDELDGFTAVDEDEPELDDAADVDFDDDGDGDADAEGELDEDDDETVLPSLLEDDEIAVVVAEVEDDDDEDALRDGEFVCRSCFMAKRESALADPEAMLCRDCA